MNNIITIENGRLASLRCSDWFASQPCAEGYESAQPLPHPKSGGAAGQCREMGVTVGDTIVGREGDSKGTWWNETRLTLLWAGQSAAAFRVERRNKGVPTWRDDGEAADWTLNSRKWYLANAGDVPRAAKKD